MASTPGSAWRSISGRLYAAIGMMFIAMVGTNVQTIVYSDTVAAGAKVVAVGSIEGVHNADEFDERLDQHRRVLTMATEVHNPAATDATVARLTEIEQGMADNPALSAAAGGSSVELAFRLTAHVAQLRALSRTALSSATAAHDDAEAARAPESYIARTNEIEEDISAWKTQMRESAATALGTMSARAEVMHKLYLAVTAGACVIGLMAVLISRGVLGRLRRLTSSMLSLAAGDMAVEVPFRGDRDEVGLLANALEVFRDQACRVISSEANLSAALETMVEGIVMLAADWRVVLHNHRFAEMLGLPGHDCAGMTWQEILDHLTHHRDWPADTIREFDERLMAISAATGVQTFDVNIADRCFYTMTGAVMPNGKLLLSVEDVTERRASAARIFHLAHHDSLTGLVNRSAFEQRLGEAVDDAVTEQGIGVTLLLCDLDHFKEVNDTYGHPAGDELLCEVARRMRETMRKTDILARLGGDEFAIIHLSGPEPQEAHALAERTVAALRRPFTIQGHMVCIGVSIGIAHAPIDAESLVDLMKRADLALYAAKKGGRNMFMAYDAGMAEKLAERRAIESEMRKALDANGFQLRYQPLVDLHTRRIIGFEALARWNDPVRGSVPPSVFIPIAEECGFIIQLGEWVLRTACTDAVGWGGDTTIAVNVASQQFREGFVNTVRSALRDSGLPAHRLEIEITETAMLNDGDKVLSVLRALRAMGVQLSMDDFGTGYSALNYLQKFQFDKIKIDQSFVRDLENKDESAAIVRAVAGLGAHLGIRTLAEGVETEEQAKTVFNAGCGEAQGYLFSRPVPPEAVAKMLEEQADPVLLEA